MGRHRSAKLLVWVTPGEREEIERRAEEAGLDASDWVRRTLLGDQIEADGRALRWQIPSNEAEWVVGCPNCGAAAGSACQGAPDGWHAERWVLVPREMRRAVQSHRSARVRAAEQASEALL